jgi:hypothetical protein
MSDMIKTLELGEGKGCIKYRVPNVIEQLRFFSSSGWYSDECQSDIYLRTLKAIETGRDFIVAVEGLYNSIDEVLSDRSNIDALIQFAWDLAAAKLGDSTKKP